MADKEIKKVVINASSLPPINANEEKYVIRYRIISEDKNRTSHWSPQYLISPVLSEIDQDENILVTYNSGFLTAAWNSSASESVLFDVYVAWGYTSASSVGNFEYFSTVNGRFALIPVPQTATKAKVIIQSITYPKQIVEYAKIAESSIKSTSS